MGKSIWGDSYHSGRKTCIKSKNMKQKIEGLLVQLEGENKCRSEALNSGKYLDHERMELTQEHNYTLKIIKRLESILKES